MFEGDSADMCVGKFSLMSWDDERTVKRAQTVSEDPIGVNGNFQNCFFERGMKQVIIFFLSNKDGLRITLFTSANHLPVCLRSIG